MNIPTKEKPKLPSYPSSWPRDGRSKVIYRDDVIILMHPDRSPHKLDAATKTWSLL